MKAAGRVHYDLVDLLGAGRADGVEDHSCRIRAFLLMDHWRADPFGPDFELVYSRGSEGVGGGEDHTRVGLHFALRELGGGRRLAGAVDPDQEGDTWFLRYSGHRLSILGRPQERDQLLANSRPQLFGGGDAAGFDLFAERVHQAKRELDAGVRGNQRFLEAIEIGGRHRALSAERFTRLFQELGVGHEETAFELSEQSSSHHTPVLSRSVSTVA